MPYNLRPNYNLSVIDREFSLNVTGVSIYWECQMLKPAPANKHSAVSSSITSKRVDSDQILLPCKAVLH